MTRDVAAAAAAAAASLAPSAGLPRGPGLLLGFSLQNLLETERCEQVPLAPVELGLELHPGGDRGGAGSLRGGAGGVTIH